jgi:acyl-CoA synthetase (AMP-forming)/AMP-acid ligase II
VQPHDLAEDKTEPVPIGVACENIEVFAVSEQGELVWEPGREGELWVRGSCVAQGYWGDPEKTARGFVHNDFNPHYNEMAYRTGDIVTLDEDGRNWRYIGRRDHMIKSRGYRIELGEIEAALYNHEHIMEAAVIPIPDEVVGNRIKAFIVTDEPDLLDAKAVKAHCVQYLPGYMIPEFVEFRETLPKTSTGKVNRTLLVGFYNKD